jgi:uncharacterized integral membrane protein
VSEPAPTDRQQLRRVAPWVVLGLIALYVVAFVLKNDDKVDLDFVFFTAHVGLIWLLLLGFALGLAVGVLVVPLYRRRRRDGRR